MERFGSFAVNYVLDGEHYSNHALPWDAPIPPALGMVIHFGEHLSALVREIHVDPCCEGVEIWVDREDDDEPLSAEEAALWRAHGFDVDVSSATKGDST